MTGVFPRRNLGAGEHWGRTVENRISAAERSQEVARQGRGGFGRSSDSTSQGVAVLATRISETVEEFPRYFASADSLVGFGIGAGWTTVARVVIPHPRGGGPCGVTARAVIASQQDVSVSSTFEWPFSLVYVTSEFGARPPLPFHNGIDFSYPGILGTPIPAAGSGTVILQGYYSDWGNYLRIGHTSITGIPGTWTGYAHMDTPALVGMGDPVTLGQIVGYVGNTGYSFGAHLHFETALYDVRINPRDFMDAYASTSSDVEPVQARIIISGVASPTFEPLTETGLSQKQSTVPISGRDFVSASQIVVDLQVRTPTKTITARPGNVAVLSVEGSAK